MYINERLTKNKRTIFAKVRPIRKEKNFKFVWTNNGSILMKKEGSSKAICITNEQDIEKL